MNKILLMVITCASLSSMAAEQTQVLAGAGIDGNPCSIQVTRDGNQLKNASIKGAAEVFEILAEKGSGYGPRREIRSHGGEEIVPDAAEMYQYFRHSENLFSDGETFKLDTSDVPQSEESLGPLKMQVSIELRYDQGQLVSATVINKAKALLVATLASSKFTCQK